MLQNYGCAQFPRSVDVSVSRGRFVVVWCFPCLKNYVEVVNFIHDSPELQNYFKDVSAY